MSTGSPEDANRGRRELDHDNHAADVAINEAKATFWQQMTLLITCLRITIERSVEEYFKKRK